MNLGSGSGNDDDRPTRRRGLRARAARPHRRPVAPDQPARHPEHDGPVGLLVGAPDAAEKVDDAGAVHEARPGHERAPREQRGAQVGGGGMGGARIKVYSRRSRSGACFAVAPLFFEVAFRDLKADHSASISWTMMSDHAVHPVSGSRPGRPIAALRRTWGGRRFARRLRTPKSRCRRAARQAGAGFRSGRQGRPARSGACAPAAAHRRRGQRRSGRRHSRPWRACR